MQSSHQDARWEKLSTLIYELLRPVMRKLYIGKNQDYPRSRVYQHITSIWKMREHQMRPLDRKKNNMGDTDITFNVIVMSKKLLHFAVILHPVTKSEPRENMNVTECHLARKQNQIYEKAMTS